MEIAARVEARALLLAVLNRPMNRATAVDAATPASTGIMSSAPTIRRPSKGQSLALLVDGFASPFTLRISGRTAPICVVLVRCWYGARRSIAIGRRSTGTSTFFTIRLSEQLSGPIGSSDIPFRFLPHTYGSWTWTSASFFCLGTRFHSLALRVERNQRQTRISRSGRVASTETWEKIQYGETGQWTKLSALPVIVVDDFLGRRCCVCFLFFFAQIRIGCVGHAARLASARLGSTQQWQLDPVFTFLLPSSRNVRRPSPTDPVWSLDGARCRGSGYPQLCLAVATQQPTTTITTTTAIATAVAATKKQPQQQQQNKQSSRRQALSLSAHCPTPDGPRRRPITGPAMEAYFRVSFLIF